MTNTTGIRPSKLAEMLAEVEYKGYLVKKGPGNMWNAEILCDWLFAVGFETKEECISAAFDYLYGQLPNEAPKRRSMYAN